MRRNQRKILHNNDEGVNMADSTTPTSDRKRLHITPFNQDLLDRFIPPSLRPSASGVSFHTVQTALERGFGYVELPRMEADKLRKKFNGSTLKGSKVRIEDAKPEKKRKVEVEENEDARKARKKAKRVKRKREEGVLSGHELEEGRHVKRGWKDEGADKKNSKKAKTSDDGGKETLKGKKMLFKTSIPPNAVPVETKAKRKAKDKKEKSGKDGTDGKEKQKAVVQEFSKTQKPIISTADTPNGKGTLRYEDGKGWVDESGAVVEAAPVSKRPRRAKPVSLSEDSAKVMSTPPAVSAVHVPASGTPLDDVSGFSEESSLVESSEDVSSDEDSEGNGTQLSVIPTTQNDPAETPEPPSNVEDEAKTPEQAREVHPLEALFKRPAASRSDSASKAKKPSPIDTSFNFFAPGEAADNENGDAEVQPAYPPQTPHTKQDLEWRGMRSAAPTPDTAAIGRKFSFPFARAGGDADIDEDEEDEDEEVNGNLNGVDEDMPDANSVPVAGGKEGEKEESEFRKWFYEHRGDLNRGWKKRRREERKHKRQRENRRLSRRVV